MCFPKRICILGFGGKRKKMIFCKISQAINFFFNSLDDDEREDIALLLFLILSIVGFILLIY